MGEFCIAANLIEQDSTLRIGAKCYLVGGTGGEGFDRFVWRGLSAGPRRIEKWVNSRKFANFRPAWITEGLRELHLRLYFEGTKDEMQAVAVQLNEHAAKLRSDTVIDDDFDSSCETERVECLRCGEMKNCILSSDPYIREIHPEDENEPAWWCYKCYDQRSGDI